MLAFREANRMQATGLEIDGSKILLASTKRGKKGVDVFSLYTFSITHPPQKKDVKQLYNALAAGRGPLVTGLASAEVLLKSIPCKIASSQALRKTLPFQLQSQTFLDPKDAIFLPFLTKEGEKKSLTTFMTTKQALQKHLSYCQGFSLDPEYVSLGAQGLFRFALEICHFEEGPLLHVGWASSTLVRIEEKKLVFFQSLPMGKKDLLDASSREVFTKEMLKLFYSFQEMKKLPLLLTGYAEECFPFLKTALAPYYAKIFTPSQKELFQEYKHHAIPIGLTLDAAAKDGESLQFRIAEFTPSRHLKTLGKKVAGFMAINLVLALFLFFWGNKEASRQKTALLQNLGHMIQKDRDWLKKPLLQEDENPLEAWKAALKKEAKPFPYFLQAPTVSETLAWLQEQAVDWKKIHYELVQYPKVDSLDTPYLAKVGLELTFPSLETARTFHERLLKDPFVNGQSEVAWEGEGNTYKTSFLLQTR